MAIGDGGGGQQPGLSGADLARINQATSSSAKAGDFDSLIDAAIIGQSENSGTFFGMKLGSLLNTGLLAHFNPPQSPIEKPILQAAASFSPKGGRFADFFASFKPEFSKIVAPQIAASMQDFSFASLGNISPMQTPSGGMGMGMGLA